MLHKEICVAVTKREEMKYCLQRLQSLNTKVDYHEGKKFTRFCINVDDSLVPKVKELVAEIILIRRKFEYIRERLEIKEYTPCLCSLVSALVYFESAEEIARVSNIIAQSSVYNIDGIFDFRIGDIKADWLELVELTNSLLVSGYREVDVYNVASFMISPRIKIEKSIFIADIKATLLTNVTRGGVIDVLDLYHDDEYNIINAVIAESPSEVIVEGEDANNRIVQTLKNIMKIKVI